MTPLRACPKAVASAPARGRSGGGGVGAQGAVGGAPAQVLGAPAHGSTSRAFSEARRFPVADWADSATVGGGKGTCGRKLRVALVGGPRKLRPCCY